MRSPPPMGCCSPPRNTTTRFRACSRTGLVGWRGPPADIPRIFGGKPVALIGASPGGFGTILSQNAWLPVLRTLGADLWSEGRLLVSRAQGVFDQSGTLTDAAIKDRLRGFLHG